MIHHSRIVHVSDAPVPGWYVIEHDAKAGCTACPNAGPGTYLYLPGTTETLWLSSHCPEPWPDAEDIS